LSAAAAATAASIGMGGGLVPGASAKGAVLATPTASGATAATFSMCSTTVLLPSLWLLMRLLPSLPALVLLLVLLWLVTPPLLLPPAAAGVLAPAPALAPTLTVAPRRRPLPPPPPLPLPLPLASLLPLLLLFTVGGSSTADTAGTAGTRPPPPVFGRPNATASLNVAMLLLRLRVFQMLGRLSLSGFPPSAAPLLLPNACMLVMSPRTARGMGGTGGPLPLPLPPPPALLLLPPPPPPFMPRFPPPMRRPNELSRALTDAMADLGRTIFSPPIFSFFAFCCVSLLLCRRVAFRSWWLGIYPARLGFPLSIGSHLPDWKENQPPVVRPWPPRI
jgi:hypothetical protein